MIHTYKPVHSPSVWKYSTSIYGSGGFLRTEFSTRRMGFTLIEVMIAMAVLTVGMFGVLSMIPTLSSARTLALEMVVARQVASSLAERIQGATWKELGGTQQNPGTYNTEAWSLPRYREGTPINPPMTQNDINPYHNLISTGLLAQTAGVPDLKVYLEYYHGRIMTDPAVRATDRTTWYAAITGTAGINNRKLDFADFGTGSTDSVIVRIQVTWREQNGAPMNSHEIFTARKR